MKSYKVSNPDVSIPLRAMYGKMLTFDFIDMKVGKKEWKPIATTSSRGPKISHLLFADDLILFAKATVSQARVVRKTVREFCSCSGMMVNSQKSKRQPYRP